MSTEPPGTGKAGGPGRPLLGRLSPGSQVLMATGHKHRLVGGLGKGLGPASPVLIARGGPGCQVWDSAGC